MLLVSQATGLEVQDITLDDDAESLALWDSVAHINLVMAIETALGRDLKTEEVMDVTSVAGIHEILAKAEAS